jgi:tetratricopeptide (TPR) repeat protein
MSGQRQWIRRAIAAVGLLALTVLTSPGCNRDDPAGLEYAARANFAAGRLEEAEDRLGRLARLRPLTVPERVLRAQVAHDRGRLDEAIAALDEPRASEPRRGPDAALLSAWRGWLEMQRHRFRAAEGHLRRALELDPGRAQARRQLIDLLAYQGRAAEIAAQARALARSGTLDFAYLYVWTLGQREGLDPAEEAKLLEDASQADPADYPSRLALADCLRRLGRLDQAEAVLGALDQADPEVRAASARVALDRGDPSAAEALLAAGPEGQGQGHDHPSLAQLRGRLALLRGDAPEAVRHFRAALEVAPDNRDARFGLGQALRLMGQPEAAGPHLKAARDRDHLEWLVRGARPPDRRKNPAVLQEIAAACLAAGHRDQARAWYQLALSHDPDNPALRAALSRISPES